MEIIITSKKHGTFTILFDAEDYEKVNKHNWQIQHIAGKYYATSSIKNKRFYMHRYLMDNPKENIDHKDGNGLNNQRLNLRLCTQKQNCHNRKSSKNSTSKYIGVHISNVISRGKKYKYFKVHFQGNGVNIRKNFKDEIDAAKFRDSLSIKYYGEYANLNF